MQIKGSGHFKKIKSPQYSQIDIKLQFSDIKKMSLVEFLQQTVMKDVSHQVLSQIQSIHTATQQLLDNLSCLRELDKSSVIENKIKAVRLFIEIKQDILNSLNGFGQQPFQNWVGGILRGNPVVGELVKLHRSQIESMIIKLVKKIFVVNRLSSEQGQQQKTLNQMSHKLKTLKQGEFSKNNTNRQFIEQISKCDEKFIFFQHRFQEKVRKFNEAIQQYVIKLQKYQETVRRQFYNLIIESQPAHESSFEPQNDGRETPFKQLGLERNYEEEDRVSNSTVSEFYKGNHYGTRANTSWRESQRFQVRNPYYYETL